MEKKIFKLDQSVTQDVRAFEMTNLKPSSSEIFRTPTLTAKGPSRTTKPISELGRKDRRFQVDPVLRDMVSVDEDTNHEVEVRVRERLDALRDEAEREGKELGYEEGYARGKAEAKASFDSAAAEKLQRVDTLLAGFEGVKSEVYQANERFLVELVFRIAGSVLQKEIVIDPEYLTRVVRSVVEKVGVKEQLKLIASPGQVEALYEMLPELQAKHTGLKNITIESSSQLGDTDVVVETDWNRIDATFDTQLGSLHEVVLAALDDSHIATDIRDSSDSESA
jgi:flagellar assembly protein FliH